MLSENPKENVLRDFKIIEAGGKRFGIAQLELMEYESVLNRKGEYLTAMEEIRKENNLDYVLLMVTNILEEATKLLVAGENPEEIAKAFGKNMEEERCIYLEGVLSRKKQVVPVIQKFFG